jgi:uncharacterized protein YaiE (UPF0345 family)
MLKHNAYFDGKGQSIGFERNGRRATAGVIDAGAFHFGTEAAERMSVVSGELWVKLAGDEAFRPYPHGHGLRGAGGERVRREGDGARRLPVRVRVSRC